MKLKKKPFAFRTTLKQSFKCCEQKAEARQSRAVCVSRQAQLGIGLSPQVCPHNKQLAMGGHRGGAKSAS